MAHNGRSEQEKDSAMAGDGRRQSSMPRRKFLKISAATMGAVGGLSGVSGAEPQSKPAAAGSPGRSANRRAGRSYNRPYSGATLAHVAFPLGGIGAGMICLEGSGALSHVSLRNRPEIFNEPCVFAAIGIKGRPSAARVLEGPVPARKIFGSPGTGNGAAGTTFGLPRFAKASFQTRFPFGTVSLKDGQVPLEVEITGWSPFEPGDPDNASLPVAGLEYRFRNPGSSAVEAVFSFNAKNFMRIGNEASAVRPIEGGFILWSSGGKDKAWEEGAFAATVSDPEVKINHAWFRGGWWDALTMAWSDVANAACFERPPVTSGGPSPGGTLFVPLNLAAGASKTIALRLAWFVGQTNLRIGKDPLGLSLRRASLETTSRGMQPGLPISTVSAFIGEITTLNSGRKPAASASVFMTRHCPPKSSKRSRRI